MMNKEPKKSLKDKLERLFLETVRKCLNDEKARQMAGDVRSKYPGLTRDALADVLIKRAVKRTGVAGAASGTAITGCEALVAAPVPEPSHKVAAASGVVAAITGDLTYATAVQMRLLQEIGHIYDCPFDEEDEEDVWLVQQAAQGLKGAEKAGSFSLRFAKELHVIDVYCNSQGTNSGSYGKFFRKLLDACKSTSPALTSITLHRRLPQDFDRTREVANYKSWLSRSLRSGEALKIRYLKERKDGERMHLRAVFTDNLLITGHYGFGSGTSETETTDLTLREHSDLVTIRNLYLDDDKIGFDLMEQIELSSDC